MSSGAVREHEFDVSGGDPCLDFANTVDGRASTPVEHLNRYADVVSWARQAGVLDAEDAKLLLEESGRRAGEAERVWERAILLREGIYRTFLAVAEGRSPTEADLSILNSELSRSLVHARVVRGGDTFEWAWADEPVALDRPLWPVARAAADLLTTDCLSRVRVCCSDSCLWLFLDESRNHSRRWCDMKVCGNREKARRHYRRARAG